METLLPLIIFLVALLYSSVGHGGASGYLTVLAIAGAATEVMRPSALLLNLLVSAIAFIHFASAGHFRWRLFLPFAAGSVPAAYIGAGIVVDPLIYKRLLAACLLFAVARLLGLFGSWHAGRKRPVLALAIVLGVTIGIVSGIIGIGGGIILSPLLLLLRWSDPYEAAAVSALFIFVNSAAGLFGLPDISVLATTNTLILLAAAMAGGLIGAWSGARKASALRLRHVLGCVLLFASVKLFIA